MWWSECEEAACIDGRRLEDLFFRVYDATSRRQYQYPVGFTAEHDLFQDMPNCAWLRFIQPDVNTIDPSAVARHITGRWTGDRHREKMDFGYDLIDLGSDQEEQSKWISTTTSFDWAFYEMARRLARRSKYGHVIDHVSFATIDAGEPRPGYRGIQHIRNSKHVAQRLREIRDDSPELQLHLSDRYARAIRFADASSEWLYYGRIFDKSIYSIHHSTREHLFISQYNPLVKHFFKPNSELYAGQTWFQRLIFDPVVDSYAEAERKFDHRRKQLEYSGYYDHFDCDT